MLMNANMKPFSPAAVPIGLLEELLYAGHQM